MGDKSKGLWLAQWRIKHVGICMKAIQGTDNQDLKSAGLKATLPRRLVLEIIRASSERHLSAEDVYRRLLKQGSDVGLATVYRVLAQLESAGLLSRNVFESGKALYEVNEGGDHDHLICLGCGRVDEFRNDAIEVLRQDVAAIHHYRLTRHRLALYGYCPDCTRLP
jgi:Fur family ferric uptake transcriptional regulator